MRLSGLNLQLSNTQALSDDKNQQIKATFTKNQMETIEVIVCENAIKPKYTGRKILLTLALSASTFRHIWIQD
jgi:hypothetical protein